MITRARSLLVSLALVAASCTLSTDSKYLAPCNLDGDCAPLVCVDGVCVDHAPGEGEGEGDAGEGEGEGTGACNFDGFCDVDEAPPCIDCLAPCNHDGVCDVLAGETAGTCSDCTPGEGEGEGGEGEGEGEGEGGEGEGEGEGPAPACGDDVVEAPEECDDGLANSDSTPNACRTDCKLAHCGDGVIDAGEACDPPNGNVCSAACTLTSDPAAVSFQAVACNGGVDDTELLDGTFVALAGKTSSGTAVPVDATTQLLSASLPGSGSVPGVSVSNGTHVDIDATTAAPGTYPFDWPTTSADVCLHVHIVDPASVKQVVANGTWESSTAWGGPVPSAGDVVYLGGGHSLVVTQPETAAAVFIEGGAVLSTTTGAGTVTVTDAFINGGTDSIAGGGSFPSFAGYLRFTSGTGTPVASGHVDRAGLPGGTVVQIGSVQSTEINAVTQGAAQWSVGAHRLDCGSASFSGGGGGLVMNAAAGVARFDTLHHANAYPASKPALWTAGTLVVDVLPDITSWPGSAATHNFIDNPGGGIMVQSYAGVMTVPTTASPLVIGGAVAGKLILGVHATATMSVLVNDLDLLSTPLIDDVAHWSVTTCSGAQQTPPCGA